MSDLRETSRRIVVSSELRTERGFDAALRRQGAPVARRPRPTAHRAVAVDDAGSTDSVDAPQDDLCLRNPRLVDSGDRPCARADGGVLLCLQANRHSRLIREADQWQVERLADVDEPLDGLRS